MGGPEGRPQGPCGANAPLAPTALTGCTSRVAHAPLGSTQLSSNPWTGLVLLPLTAPDRALIPPPHHLQPPEPTSRHACSTCPLPRHLFPFPFPLPAAPSSAPWLAATCVCC